LISYLFCIETFYHECFKDLIKTIILFLAGRGIAKVVQTKFDARTLHERPAVAAQSRMVDDGKGAKEIFRVDNFDLLQVKFKSNV